jgi:hypothetical protein
MILMIGLKKIYNKMTHPQHPTHPSHPNHPPKPGNNNTPSSSIGMYVPFLLLIALALIAKACKKTE